MRSDYELKRGRRMGRGTDRSQGRQSTSVGPQGLEGRRADVTMKVDGSDEEDERRPKREASAHGASPPKSRRGETAISEDMLRQLLHDTQTAILNAQQATLTQALRDLQTAQDKRFTALESQVSKQTKTSTNLQDQITALATRVSKVEDGSTAASSEAGVHSDAARRKLTLVIGGFAADTRRATILDKVNTLLADLKLKEQTDENPFCTGPRRTCALLPFKIRPGEGMSEAKDRMHRVLSAIVASKTTVSGMSRPLWCGVSKTPAERLRSSHCGLLRRVIAALDGQLLPHAEHDHIRGSTWLGSTLVGCTSTKAPPIDSYKIFHVPEKKGHWVNISGLAAELKVQFFQVEDELKRACE